MGLICTDTLLKLQLRKLAVIEACNFIDRSLSGTSGIAVFVSLKPRLAPPTFTSVGNISTFVYSNFAYI